MKKLKWWLGGTIAAFTISGAIVVIVIFLIFSSSLNGGKDCDSNDNPSLNVVTGVSGSYTDKNSDEYKTGKALFEFLTKTMGFSGAGAAGAVGNAIGESGLKLHNPNPGGGVNGLFQWSGWSNTINGSRITSEGSIKAGDTSTLTLENELKLVKYELEHGYSKVKRLVGKATDVHEATRNWFLHYEGMVGNEDQFGNLREAGAEWAYKEFGGSEIVADDNILSGSNNTIDATQQTKNDDDYAQCGSGNDIEVSGEWCWPFESVPKEGPKLVGEQNYGKSDSRANGFHDGVDFGDALYSGDVRAIHSGKIVKIMHPNESGLGFYLIWEVTEDGYGIAYQEFASGTGDISVKEGDTVSAGDKIGVSRKGETGINDTHLHLGITREKNLAKALSKAFTDDGTWLDPVKTIKKGMENNGDK